MTYFLHKLKQSVLALASLFISLALIVGVVYVYLAAHLPSTDELHHLHYDVPLRVYTKNGELIDTFGAQYRLPAKFNDMPALLRQSFIAAEDHRFHEHIGIDFVGLARAFHNLVQTGRKSQGASTITMQVARNFFLSRHKTFKRKFKELLLALKIDAKLSKNDILTLYLNKIYLGEGAYGVKSAAQIYYGKDLEELTLSQMAMIAGLPQAPSTDNPLTDPQAALERRDYVLQRLYQLDRISHQQYQNAKHAPLTAEYHGERHDLDAPYVAEAIRRMMVKKLGDQAYHLGLQVYTTIDGNMQNNAQTAVKQGLFQYTKRHGYKGPIDNWGWPSLHRWGPWQKKLAGFTEYDHTKAAVLTDVQDHSCQALFADGSTTDIPWQAIEKLRPQSKWGWPKDKPENAHEVLAPGDVVYVRQGPRQSGIVQIPDVEGSFIAMDPHNGAIKALVGGFSFKRSHFIRPLQALRQPGSSFKPFLYSAALAHGYTLADVLNDAPVVLNDVDADMIWRPKNAGNRFHGSTSLRQALIHSRNLISIRLLQKLGIPESRQFIQRFGFDTEHLPQSLSLALGSGVTTSKRLTSAISTFANGGHRVDSYIVDRIDNQFDRMIYQNDPPRAYPQYGPHSEQNTARSIISAENAYLINDALHNVIQSGTAQRAKTLGRDDIAGKTGTTNQLHDAWFTGYHPDLAATSWVGYDDPENLHEYGNQAALPIWIEFMKTQLPDLAYKKLAQPPGIIAARINPQTGKLAEAGDKEARFELFRRQNLPQHARSSSGDDQRSPQYLF